ncbi:hypothetical protein GCM10029992_36440 [Glycomyces albus]
MQALTSANQGIRSLAVNEMSVCGRGLADVARHRWNDGSSLVTSASEGRFNVKTDPVDHLAHRAAPSFASAAGAGLLGDALGACGKQPLVGRSDVAKTTIGVTIEIPEPWRSELQAARRASGDLLAERIPRT